MKKEPGVMFVCMYVCLWLCMRIFRIVCTDFGALMCEHECDYAWVEMRYWRQNIWELLCENLMNNVGGIS